jgi:hypothetical protein
MISQQALFRGTKFERKLQSKIYKDIRNMVDFFPDLKPIRYQGPNGVRVLLRGQAHIFLDSKQDFPVTLSICLPINFPDVPPIIQILIPPGKRPQPNGLIRGNGAVIMDQIYSWVPGRTTLATFVNALVHYFGANPPFIVDNSPRLTLPIGAPDLPPKEEEDDAIHNIVKQTAIEGRPLFHAGNAKITEVADLETEQLVIADFHCIVSVLRRDLAALNERSQIRLTELEESEPTVSNGTVSVLRHRAKNEAYQETLREMRRCMREHCFPIDKILQTVRRLSRDHFERNVLPAL